MSTDKIPYGTISTTQSLGELLRQHRKHRGLTLETVAGLANVSVRFFSEIERGKETAEIGKVIKALNTVGLEIAVVPRHSYDLHVKPALPVPNDTSNDD